MKYSNFTTFAMFDQSWLTKESYRIGNKKKGKEKLFVYIHKDVMWNIVKHLSIFIISY